MENNEFISIIREHRKLIYKICYCYCSNLENRKDLQQEIFLQLWKSFDKFDGHVKISTWIYRIALNTAISFYRNDNKHHIRRTPIDAEVISLADDPVSTEIEYNIQKLYQIINQFTSMNKALILLYLDDHKYADIAQILGITETNVATKINRIKKSLREQFNNH